MAFYVGQKVVCVSTGEIFNTPVEYRPKSLEIGSVYTVSHTGYYRHWQTIDLAECPATRDPVYATGLFEPSYSAGLFRAAVERKTDISIFTKMLTPDRVDA